MDAKPITNPVQIDLARSTNNLSSYDLIHGERPPSREFAPHRSISGRGPNPKSNNQGPSENDPEREKQRKELEELKTEIKSLSYIIENHKQEQELAKLRHEGELRKAQAKGEDDFNNMQTAESEKSKAVRQYEALLKELNEVQNGAINEKAALERQVRDAEETKRVLEEDSQDLISEKEEAIRSLERKVAELDTRNKTLQKSVEELQGDSDRRETLLQETQQQLLAKENSVGQLEGEVLQLKAQVVDVESAQTVKRELNEQLAHVRKLESTNRLQESELKHLKQLHKATEVVEEEKRSLQRKLDAREGLENELGEAIIQRQRLEDERLAWTAYLQSQAGADGKLEFESPEALARSFVAERIQTATLTERIGAVEAESSEKDSIIRELEEQKLTLKQEVEKAKSTTPPSSKDSSAKVLRLERQKALANKEVQYLRDQLKVYDSEDATFQPDSVDEAKQKRIQELEDIVDQYRLETQTLTTELQTREAQVPPPTTGSKRPFEATAATENKENEQLGQLARKNRKLQDDYSSLKSSHRLLEKELHVAKERLSAASKFQETRVLSLRNNPTSDYEAIKQITLTTLRQENEQLLAQLESTFTSHAHAQIPLSTLKATELKISALETQLASQTKRNDRLLKTWGTKTNEFRQSIVDLLGWDVQFLKDGKMKVTSHFYPAEGDEEHSILFDGNRGSMKVSGGPESPFALKIKGSIDFWVKGQSCVPGLLAALTLEFYDEQKDGNTAMIDA